MTDTNILHFDGCPAYLEAGTTLREVLFEEGIGAGVRTTVVNTDGEAQELRFSGSPTIRMDGRDLLPTPERGDRRLGCRANATPEGA